MKKQKLFMVIHLLVLSAVFLTNGASNVSATSEQVTDDYFEEYANMTQNSDPENILIVKSQEKPNNYGAERVIEMPNQLYYLQYETAEDLNKAWNILKNDQSIIIVPNITLSITEGENNEGTDEAREYMSWGIEAMGLNHMIEAIENNGNQANSVLAAVIDTGVKTSVFNERFPERTLHGYCVETCESGMDDTAGHGTHVLGTVADATSNNVELLMIRAGTTGSFSLTNLLISIEYATEHDVDVLNISAGTTFDFDNETYNAQYDMTWGEIYRQAWEIEKGVIDEAVSAGITIVASSSNNGSDTIVYPAGYDNVISVGAVNRNLETTTPSNHDEHLNYVAPGVAIKSLNSLYNPDNGQSITTLNTGTSMAAPHITAAIAGLKSFNKNLSFDNVIEILDSRAIDLGDAGRDNYYGNGFVNFSESDFCTPNARCDKYGVFIDPSPVEEVDPIDVDNKKPTEDTENNEDKSYEEEITVPNTGDNVNTNNQGASISLFSIAIIIVVVPGIFRRVVKITKK